MKKALLAPFVPARYVKRCCTTLLQHRSCTTKIMDHNIIPTTAFHHQESFRSPYFSKSANSSSSSRHFGRSSSMASKNKKSNHDDVAPAPATVFSSSYHHPNNTRNNNRLIHHTSTRNGMRSTDSDHNMNSRCRRRCYSSNSISSSNSKSVLRDEVEKFSSMDKTWWDPTKNPLISMNPIRVQYILDRVQERKQQQQQEQSVDNKIDHDDDHNRKRTKKLHGLTALDVGCGGGLLSESLARLGAKVTAIDPSEALIGMAKIRLQHDPTLTSHHNNNNNDGGIDYRSGYTVEKLAEERVPKQQQQQQQQPLEKDQDNNNNSNGNEEEDHLYDIVCILEVVEHVTELESLLAAACSLCKSNGIVIISSVNRTIKSYGLAIVGAEYIMGYLPVGTHDWNKFVSPVEMHALLHTITTTTKKKKQMVPLHVAGMIPTSPPLPFYRHNHDGNWKWKLDPLDTDVNWISSYVQK